MSTATTVSPTPTRVDPLEACGTCCFRGCDIKILGCGCTLHTRCVSSIPLDAKAGCPKCSSASEGFYLVPLSFSALDEAQERNKTCAGHGDSNFLGFGNQKSEVSSNVDTLLSSERTGRWTPEEIAYVNCLVSLFDSGKLLLTDGTKLIDFLSSMLKCKASRLTKKFRQANLARGYVYNTMCQGNDAEERLKVSRAFEKFVCIFQTDYQREEIKLLTGAQWRKYLVDFCFQKNKQHPLRLLQHAEEYLRSVEELDRRSSKLKEESAKRRKLHAIEFANGITRMPPPKRICTERQCSTTWNQGSRRIASDVLDVEPLPVHSVSAVCLSEFSGQDNSVGSETMANGRTSTISLEDQSGNNSCQDDDAADEEFLNLWGLSGSDVDIVPGDENDVGGNPFVASSVISVGSCSRQSSYEPSLPLSHFNHDEASRHPETAQNSRVSCHSVDLPNSTARDIVKNVQHDSHPFLSKLHEYASRCGSLPFDYFDLWVPTFVDDDALEDESGASIVCPISSDSAATCKAMKLIYAGHFALQPKHASSTSNDLSTFGEYSSHFQFEPKHGMPGRVHFSGVPSWEQTVNQASRDYFMRAEGAAVVGIKTAVGIPIRSEAVGTVVVGCYSTLDLQKNEELVTRLLNDLGEWNPLPKWKLVIEEGSSGENGFATGAAEAGGLSSTAETKFSSCGFSSASPECSLNEHISSVDSFDSPEKEISALLAEHIPVSGIAETESESLLRGFMSLRLLLIRSPDKRTQQDRDMVDVICGSYRGYKSRGPIQKWSTKELTQVIVREFMFLTGASKCISPQIQLPCAPSQLEFSLGTPNVLHRGRSESVSTVTTASSLSTFTATPSSHMKSSEDFMMHPVSPVLSTGHDD